MKTLLLYCSPSLVWLLCPLFEPAASIVLQEDASITAIPSTPCTSQQFAEKEYDVIVVGASGVLGKLSSDYLAGHPDKRPWAMAGRSTEKLADLGKQGITAKSFTGGGKFAVDLHNARALNYMVNKTRVVLNLAGPYEEHSGQKLIQSALESCAHYVDVSTEVHWNSRMLALYHIAAQARGLAVVQSAGFNSLMPDLLASLAAADLPPLADGKPAAPSDLLVVWTKLNGGTSGGAIAAQQHDWTAYGAITNPYILTPEAPEQARSDRAVNLLQDLDGQLFGQRQLVLQEYTGAKLDSPLVRRSMALQFPGRAVSVREGLTNDVVESLKNFTKDPHMYLQPPSIRPEPGEGPPAWMLETGAFEGMSAAVGETGALKHVSVAGAGDPSFTGTAKMATEMSLGLAARGVFEHGGYLTPASALGPKALEQRLASADGGKFVVFEHRLKKTMGPEQLVFASAKRVSEAFDLHKDTELKLPALPEDWGLGP